VIAFAVVWQRVLCTLAQHGFAACRLRVFCAILTCIFLLLRGAYQEISRMLRRTSHNSHDVALLFR